MAATKKNIRSAVQARRRWQKKPLYGRRKGGKKPNFPLARKVLEWKLR